MIKTYFEKIISYYINNKYIIDYNIDNNCVYYNNNILFCVFNIDYYSIYDEKSRLVKTKHKDYLYYKNIKNNFIYFNIDTYCKFITNSNCNDTKITKYYNIGIFRLVCKNIIYFTTKGENICLYNYYYIDTFNTFNNFNTFNTFNIFIKKNFYIINIDKCLSCYKLYYLFI